MSAHAVEPQLVDSLFTNVHSIADLVVVDLVAVELILSDQHKLSEQVGDLVRVRRQYHFEKGVSVSFSDKETLGN
jgi:hypothetical protein